MNTEEIRKSFRTVNRENYPELQDYTDEQIWEDNMGPGGLYLAVEMARKVNLKAGDIVMDLGCCVIVVSANNNHTQKYDHKTSSEVKDDV